jgi:transcriptional regulator with XRE-family HTH domain
MCKMADGLGIDRSYISDMETGKRNVCLPSLEVFALGFRMSIFQAPLQNLASLFREQTGIFSYSIRSIINR